MVSARQYIHQLLRRTSGACRLKIGRTEMLAFVPGSSARRSKAGRATPPSITSIRKTSLGLITLQLL